MICTFYRSELMYTKCQGPNLGTKIVLPKNLLYISCKNVFNKMYIYMICVGRRFIVSETELQFYFKDPRQKQKQANHVQTLVNVELLL